MQLFLISFSCCQGTGRAEVGCGGCGGRERCHKLILVCGWLPLSASKRGEGPHHTQHTRTESFRLCTRRGGVLQPHVNTYALRTTLQTALHATKATCIRFPRSTLPRDINYASENNRAFTSKQRKYLRSTHATPASTLALCREDHAWQERPTAHVPVGSRACIMGF